MEKFNIKKERVINLVCRKKIGVLEYLIIEHSGIGPIDFLRQVIDDCEFCILYLGIDGPHLLSTSESQKLVDGMKEGGIQASQKAGFIWIHHDECPKLYLKEWFVFLGDAAIMKKQPPGDDFKCNRLAKPSGFLKDKISSKDAELLEAILSDDDVYIYDNFRDSLIVSKSPSVLKTILQQIERIRT